MNSYNSIKKIKYDSFNENEPVSLIEYIVFCDDRNESKYCVLKFKNKITQRLFKISFSVSQFDENDQLIEKSVCNYSSLAINENESFVPNAKLKLQYNCKRITCELVYAKFETVEYKEGQFEHVPYTFDEYLKGKANTVNPSEQDKKVAKKDLKTDKKLIKKEDKKENKIHYKNFDMQSIASSNKSKKPAFFTALFAIILIALGLYNVFEAKYNATYFTIGDADYRAYTYNTAELINYHGNKSEFVIPFKVNNMEVVNITTNAFKDNKKLKKLAIQSIKDEDGNYYPHSLTISSHAFDGCNNLNDVYADYCNVKLLSYSFANCTNLNHYYGNQTFVYSEAFYNCKYLQILSVNTINTIIFSDIFEYNLDVNIYYYLTRMQAIYYRFDVKDKSQFFGAALSYATPVKN